MQGTLTQAVVRLIQAVSDVSAARRPQLLRVQGDPETGAEGDVEAAVAQGRRQVGRLRAGEQQVVQHQFGELDAVAR